MISITIYSSSSTNNINSYLHNVQTLTPSGFGPGCDSSRTVLLHRHGENALLRLKTQFPEPFSTFRCQFFCTGVVVLNFLHRRGGFVKSLKTIVPVHGNRSSAKSSKIGGNLSVLARNRCTPRAVHTLFPNSDSELKGSTGGQKSGQKILHSGVRAGSVRKS